MEDVVTELLGPRHSEIRVLIDKRISVSAGIDNRDLYKELGILLGFEYEGLVIKDLIVGKKGERVGFKKGDFVIAVDKNGTRYLSLDSVVALINSVRSDRDIVFTIRRTVNLRREGE